MLTLCRILSQLDSLTRTNVSAGMHCRISIKSGTELKSWNAGDCQKYAACAKRSCGTSGVMTAWARMAHDITINEPLHTPIYINSLLSNINSVPGRYTRR